MELRTHHHKKPAVKATKSVAKPAVAGRVITDADIQRFEKNRADTQRRKEAGEDVSWNASRDWFMSL